MIIDRNRLSPPSLPPFARVGPIGLGLPWCGGGRVRCVGRGQWVDAHPDVSSILADQDTIVGRGDEFERRCFCEGSQADSSRDMPVGCTTRTGRRLRGGYASTDTQLKLNLILI